MTISSLFFTVRPVRHRSSPFVTVLSHVWLPAEQDDLESVRLGILTCVGNSWHVLYSCSSLLNAEGGNLFGQSSTLETVNSRACMQGIRRGDEGTYRSRNQLHAQQLCQPWTKEAQYNEQGSVAFTNEALDIAMLLLHVLWWEAIVCRGNLM